MKLRWHPQARLDTETPQAMLVYSEFVDPQNDPFKIRFWAHIFYLPETDSYGATYFVRDRSIQRACDEPFNSIDEAMMAVEQQLFEEGIRDDT